MRRTDRHARHAGVAPLPLWFGVALGLALQAASGVAHALPAKDYRTQEAIRCAYAQGCGRMVNNAINHARTFCQDEGGLLKGENRRDYRCEQRAIYCVVSGRIECRGRIEPTDTPSQILGLEVPERVSMHPEGQTCLDADCGRYIDHAPGRREDGVHACPNGFAMVGLAGRGNDIVCQAQARPILETRSDLDTQRVHMHACPWGWLMRGVSDDRSVLLCSRLREALVEEVSQDESDNVGLQVCEERDGRAAWLTGLDGARGGLLCGLLP